MPCRHPSASPLLSPPVLIILLPIITFLLLFYTIPPFLSLASQILQPTISVKKSWDSLNVFLVIFAILYGIFAQRNDDGSAPEEYHSHIANSGPLNIATNNTTNTTSETVLPQQWFGFSETMNRAPETGGGRLRRSSSSYPDLRQRSQDSLCEARDDNKSQFHFFDDFEINTHHRTPPVSHQSRYGECSAVIKEIQVDTFVLQPSPPPPKSPAPHTPPPTATPQQKTRRTYQSVGRKTEKVIAKKNIINEAEELEKVRTLPPTPPPPPPPRPAAPPPPTRVRSEHKRRKSNVKKEIAMVWASVVSNQRKRKKKQKATTTRYIYDSAPHDSPPEPQQQQGGGEGNYYSTRPPPSPPQPPPPPPPPYSVFHNLFKNGIMSKAKKVDSVSTPPAPTPPPTRPTLPKHRSWSTSFPIAPPTPPPQPPPVSSRRRASSASGRQPLPTKSNSDLYEENVNSGCQSPFIPVAPRSSPIKMQELKFVARGDFVKIRSAECSRCGSPELEDVDALPDKEEDSESHSQSKSQCKVNGGDGGGGGGTSVFCLSPDVNTKADNFIARLRDEWRLEKMNSMREKKKMT